ncbi:30S ribosomal protein [Tanacetum coccineum]
MEASTISSVTYFSTKFNTKTITNPISHISFPHSHFTKPKNQKTKRPTLLILAKSSSEETNVVTEDEWVKNLPDKKKPLYSHSLPCVEGWLKELGFVQSNDDRAVWVIEKIDWHAKLSLDVTDLYIRYKGGTFMVV